MKQRRFLHDGWQCAERSWQGPGARIGFSKHEWLPARVPGHIHLDLLENGVIADPFQLKNELGVQWIDERDFSYRTRFDWHPTNGAPRRTLRFEGLDTVCRVELNGKELAAHRNMFVPLELDVTNALVDGENLLEVHFESAVRVGEQERVPYLTAEGIEPSGVERFDERSFVRKAQYMYGWDWGPRLVSAGIWQPVSLLEHDGLIHDVHVTQRHAAEGVVIVDVRGQSDAGVLVHILAEEPPLIGDGVLARLERPALWYPNGLGQQPLLPLSSYLCPVGFDVKALPRDARDARAMLDAVALDRRETRLGLRRIRLLQEPDQYGQSFEFEVNGRRIWAMGANWIPDHSLPSRVTRAELRTRLESARDAGMNMLRVWGGGLYESEDFYDLCDELGLLVWQDFPFACAYYPDQGAFAEAVAQEARANVTRLRNRTCLAIWCGNNENLQLFQSKWGGAERTPPRYYGEHLYEGVIPSVLEALDPERPYIPTSPYGGETDSNQGGIGDQHYWDVWHGRGDWRHYRDSTARFSSEYGFASSCSLRVWREALAEGTPYGPADVRTVSVRDAAVRWHDKTFKGYETFLGYVALHYPEAELLEDWVYYSQLNQRDAIRCAVEHYRRSGSCRGSLIWQLNDCWPVQSWALIDSAGQPKPAWFELKRLYAPRLLSLLVNGERCTVHASLDNSETAWQGSLAFRAVSLFDGAVLFERSLDFGLNPNERNALFECELDLLPRHSTLLVAESGGHVATAVLAEPKELSLASPEAIHASLAEDGVLQLRTFRPLVDLLLTDREGTAAFGANCLTFPAAGIYRIPYRGSARELAARSLAGRHSLHWYRTPLA
ncbi:MAG TPA: hypothetical protein VGI10_22515 [Polyangiaceae bacterium]|jgi:beta-mannosidase